MKDGERRYVISVSYKACHNEGLDKKIKCFISESREKVSPATRQVKSLALCKKFQKIQQIDVISSPQEYEKPLESS